MCGRPVGGKEEVVLLVDEHARDPRQAVERPQKSARATVDHVDAIDAGVSDVHPRTTATEPDVGVIEARLRPQRDGDEAHPLEAHTLPVQLGPGAFPASTSALHQA